MEQPNSLQDTNAHPTMQIAWARLLVTLEVIEPTPERVEVIQ